MQQVELAVAAIVVGLLLAVVLAPRWSGNRRDQLTIGLVVGVAAAGLVIVPRVDVVPDEFQDAAQVAALVVVSGLLLVLGIGRRIAR
jgi:hypothetical protein